MQNQQFPLVSFFVMAYQEEEYIKDAVMGAFSQDYPNLEIILSDDNSSDHTFDIMKDMAEHYNGPHKVILNRNEPNLGPREHFNKLTYELCKGEIIVVSAGDDISAPNRTKECVKFMLDHPSVASLSCVSSFINSEGDVIMEARKRNISNHQTSIITLADYIRDKNLFIFSGESRVLRRNVINSFPPLRYSYAEDIFMFIRSLYVGSVALIREPLVLYRQRNDSIMGTFKTKQKTRQDVERFYLTNAKQIREDLKYAISHDYIDSNARQLVGRKSEEVIEWLKPKIKKSLPRRIVRRLFREIRKCCLFIEQSV